MVSEQDLATLKAAGIADPDIVVSSAAAFLRAHPVYPLAPVANALTEDEEAFLRAGGAAGVGRVDHDAIAANVAEIAGEFAEMVATAYSQQETALRLGVSASRIRQRLDNGTLYAVAGPGGRVCPRFQFVDHATLPGLERVLAALEPDAHPVAVQRFFLSAHPDLDSPTLGALAPREWLATGHDPEAVVQLASGLQ